MSHVRVALAAAITVIGTALGCAPVVMAQTPDVAASTPKQIRKAERKAARAKNAAELKELEKNGYQPGGDPVDYPQNIQNAERKANAAKAGQAKPASAP